MLLLELCEVHKCFNILRNRHRNSLPTSTLKGNLEKYLHKNADKFMKPDSRELVSRGKYSCETLLKFCYQVKFLYDFATVNHF